MPTALLAQDSLPKPDSVRLNKVKLAGALALEAGLWTGSMAYLQYVWYKDYQREDHFTFYNDNRGWLQIDKCGHMFGSYLESYYGYHLLRWAGAKKTPALIFGSTLGVLLQTPIEVWDGLYEEYGFSWGDMVANTMGSALVAGQAMAFDEQVVKMKFSFWPSPYRAESKGYLGETPARSLFYDYNGHTYWLSMPLQKIGLHAAPPWLCLSFGYGANGMFREFQNPAFYKGEPVPYRERYRQYVLSLDIDLTRIKTRSKFLKGVFQTFFWLKLPFPALEVNTLGKVRGYGVYW